MKFFLIIASIGLVFLANTKTIEMNSENGSDRPQVEDEAAEVGENKFGISLSRLRKLFDFASYKARFHKSYRSPLEESVRLKHFLANCHHVFASAVSFMFGRSSYYLAINMMSDWLPSELEALKNKHLASFRSIEAKNARQHELEPSLAEPGRFERHTNVHGPDAELAPLPPAKLRRKKRDTTAQTGSTTELDSIIKQAFDRSDDDTEHLSRDQDNASSAPSVLALLDQRWFYPQGQPAESNERMPASASTQHDVDQQQPRRNYNRDPGYKHVATFTATSAVERTYDHLPNKGRQKVLDRVKQMLTDALFSKRADTEDKQPDEVWVDHRQNGCFKNRVKQQGDCGSCYAASAIAYMEWVHCNETGELLEFSTQFIVDCGPRRYEYLIGCIGGRPFSTGSFIANYGLELAAVYPHLKKLDHRCPYRADTPAEHMGYLKANIEDIVEVEVKYMEEILKWSPLIVNHYTDFFFLFYGGGIYGGKYCEPMPNHSLLVVGHGRQNGEEYWLLRNSFGESWGESGYMKLNKNSVCIERAYVYNWNGAKFNIRRNPNVDERLAH
jgi:hypothetical protein